MTHPAPDVRMARRLVIKIGSALLVDREKGLKQGWLSALAMDANCDRAITPIAAMDLRKCCILLPLFG